MRKLKIGTHEVEYYDSIDELPVIRFHKWQKLLLIDSGIGADLASFDNHIEKARRYCRSGKADLAEKELMNLRQCVYFVQNEFSPKLLAFAALVKKIDGKELMDISDDALKETSRIISDAPNNELTKQTDSVKKKIDRELMLYFPKLFADSDVKEYFDMMRRRTMLVLQGIINGVDAPDETPEVQKITDEIVLYSNPKVFAGSEGVEIQFDKQFENLCLILAQKLNIDAKQKTVLEFYNAFEFLKDKAKKEENAAKQGQGRR